MVVSIHIGIDEYTSLCSIKTGRKEDNKIACPLAVTISEGGI